MLDCALVSDANSGHLAEPASQAISPKPMTLTSVRTLRQHYSVPCCSGQFMFIICLPDSFQEGLE